METSQKKLHFISYSNLNKWDAKFYLTNETIFNPKYKQVLFGNFLSKASIEKVQIEDDKHYKILGVRSYGKGVYLNRESLGKDLKMKQYYKAKPNHLFWCKVDTKNGAFGVVNNKLSDGFGSSNMTFAEIDTDKINVDFLQLLFTSKKIHSYLDSFVTGTTNRKYIRPDQLLEEIHIPLPTLQEQQEIVEAYFSKINEANQLEIEAKNIDQEIEKYLFTELGISINNKIEKKKGLNFVNFNQLERWDTEFILGYEQKLASKYPLVKYNDLFLSVNNGVSSRFYSNEGVRFLKVSDIKENHISNADIRYVNKYNERDLLKEDYLLITRKGTVGNSYYKDSGIFIASSEVFIIKINKSKVLGNYIAEINLSNFIQNQYKEKYTGTIMPSLSQGKLKEILIPLPPVEIQKIIFENIYNLKQNKINIINRVELLKQQANQEFEKAIFQ